MSAYGVVDAVIEGLKKYDLVVVNFANGDMVGHTGDLTAAIKAVETVDTCLGKIIENLGDREALIFADHGNCEVMIENGQPHTAHTTNPVPVILMTKEQVTLREGGALCDIAPTVLKRMGIEAPKEMTGESLV
jgi:2,3-bisphosphoglycerate-independent phosphoglycerate mutase